MYVNLGRNVQGGSAGQINLYAELPDSRLFQPSALGVNASTDVTKIYDTNQVIRQVLAPEMFVDIVPLSTRAYEMRCYSPTNQGARNPDGLYGVSGSPFVIWRIDNPVINILGGGLTGGTDNYLRIREVRSSVQRTWDYTYVTNTAASGWVLLSGDGLRSESKLSSYDSVTSHRLAKRLIKEAMGRSVVETTEEFQIFPWGESRVRLQTGPDGNGLETRWSYYDAGSSSGRYSHVSGFVRADGFQRSFDWDLAGRRISMADPWKDGGSDQSVIEYDYSPVDSMDVPDEGDMTKARTTTRKVKGVVVTRSYVAYIKNNSGAKTIIEEQAGAADAAYGDPRNLRTTTVYCSTNVWGFTSGRIQSLLRPDGSLESHSYVTGNYLVAGNDPGTFVEGGGTFVKEEISHGTVASPEGVPGKSVKDVNVYDKLGHLLLSEQYAITTDGSARVLWAVKKYDEISHLTDTFRSNGGHSQSAWSDCCGKDSETDETGVNTTYEYDSLKRKIRMTKVGIIGVQEDLATTYSSDAADHMTVTEQVSENGLRILVASNQYDTANRLVWSINQGGIVTAYLYNGPTNTVIQGSLTNITVNYLDGRIHYTMGNGVIKSWYDYGVNTDGCQWAKVYTGPAGTNSPVWQKTTTDMLGRTILEEKPGFGGGGLANSYTYNSLGQLTKISGFDSQTTLYGYDEIGEQIRSGVDLNTNGVLDLAGSDRVSETASWFEQDVSNDWWQARASIVYAGIGSATPTTNSIQKTRLTGLGIFSDFGFRISDLVSVDILGNSTISRTYVDRDAKTVTQVVTYPDSTNGATRVTVNGLLASITSKTAISTTFDYDALMRPIRQINPRTATFTTYNSLGQVASTMDAASNVTTYVYDNLGRRTQVTDALSNSTFTAYDTEGHVLATWGATYPVAYNYDPYGRMASMYTLRDSSLVISNYSSFITHTSSFDRTCWVYDEATGLLTNKLYADNHGPSYTYTPDGKLATRTWARGVVTTYNYDSLGQLTNISYSDGTPSVTFAFDRLGRQTTITDGVGTRTFTYSDALQLASETNTLGILTYAFDNLGRSAGFDAGPDYSVRYTFDPLGRFLAVSNNVGGALRAVTYFYLPGSDLVQGYTTDTGFSLMRSYEPNRNLIASITNRLGGVQLHRFDYTNDQIGRRTQRADVDLSSSISNSFAYNSRSELIDAAMGTNTFSYRYDPIGNRRTATNNAEALAYAANSLNQYTNITDPSATSNPSYDLDGNMTGYKDWTFVWDAENRLILASNATAVVSNTYDYMSRRVAKAVNGQATVFSYQGWAMIAESSATSTNSYIYGLDLSGTAQGAGTIGGILAGNFNGSTVFYCYDANGNVTDLVGTNGELLAQYQYDPFGNTIAKSGTLADVNPFRFSSKYTDEETGLVYYGYRFYQPNSGRWLSRDPIGEEMPGLWAHNKKVLLRRVRLRCRAALYPYIFIKNTPPLGVDPVGFDIWTCFRHTGWGIGNHEYLWDDRLGESCGTSSSSGFGGTSSPDDLGPGGDYCFRVDGSSGKEADVMSCCHGRANSGAYFPGVRDCHTSAGDCLGQNGLPHPEIPRFPTLPDRPTDPGYPGQYFPIPSSGGIFPF